MTAGNAKKTALFSVAVGLGWRLWAGWWPAELGNANTSLAAFAGHTFAVFVPILAAGVVLGMAGSEWFRPAKFELPLLLAVAALFFLGVPFRQSPGPY